MLGSLLDRYLLFGRYVIPLDDVDEEISSAIIEAIEGRYVLTMNVGQDKVRCYVLCPLEEESSYSALSRDWAEMLYEYLHSGGCHFFKEMDLDEYFGSNLYQKAIDKALLLANNRVHNRRNLGLKVKGNKLVFVEARLK